MAPLTAKLAELGDLNGANMAKMVDPKINHFFDASWDRRIFKILLNFGGRLGRKLAPKSNQKSIPALKAKNQLNASWLDFS